MDFYKAIFLISIDIYLAGGLPINQHKHEVPSEYLYGRNRNEYRYVINNLQKLREMTWQKHGITAKHHISNSDITGVMDDIIFTKKEIDAWLKGNHASGIFKRIKRNMLNFEEYPEQKWTFPMPYVINTTTITDTVHQNMMRRALEMWEEKTCVTFRELESVEGVTDQYLYIHGDADRCSSYVGKQDVQQAFPQYVNMKYPGCFNVIGTAVHEIGHALGIYHEHQRPDRDDFVTVMWENIPEDDQFNFEKQTTPHVTQNGNPYAYNSIMHYGARHFSIDKEANKYALVPKNLDYLSLMGQSSQLSFYDAKIVNTAYCSNTCSNQLSCQNGGYQNPKNCRQCLCPDQWVGTLCDVINPGSEGCSPFTSSREHTSEDTGIVFYLYTPSSDKFGHFIPGESCFWKLKVPENMFIKFWFGEGFGLSMSIDGICLFWVEIRNPSEEMAKRYCGHYNEQPPFIQYSQTNEALVLFQSFSGLTPTPEPERSFNTYGFKLFYKFSTCDNGQCDQSPCSCQEFLDNNQQIHEDLCVTRSWCRNNGHPDPNNCGKCICQDGWKGTYCTELSTENTCGNTIQCYYGGQQDPSNCNQCICPEERTGSQCQAVAEGSGECSLASGNYLADEINVTYSLSSGLVTAGKKCYWQMKSPANTYMEFTVVRTFGLYKSADGVCIFWLEIFDPTLDVDTSGRRFCGFQGSTSPAKFQTENNVAFIVFKSFDEEFPTDSTANMGFTLYLEAKIKSDTSNTEKPTTAASKVSTTTQKSTIISSPTTKSPEKTDRVFSTNSGNTPPVTTDSHVQSSKLSTSALPPAQTTQSSAKTGDTHIPASITTETSASTVETQQSTPVITSGVGFLVPIFTTVLLAVWLSVVCGQIDLRFYP